MLIPLLNDCVRVLDETGVSPEDLDKAMTLGAGWPLGPCALLDLVGIDVHVHASETLHAALGEERMAPPERLLELQRAGKLGRKSGRGLLRVRELNGDEDRVESDEHCAAAPADPGWCARAGGARRRSCRAARRS